MIRSATTLLLILLSVQWLAGQEHHLRLVAEGPLPRKVRDVSELRNPEAVPAALSEALARAIAEGRLEASVDGCTVERDTTTCRLHMGRLYQWARLSRGNVDPEIASQAHFREKFYQDRPVTPAQVGRLVEDLLDHCEDSGFPFASIRLDSLRHDSLGLHASIRLDKGRFVKLDSVLVKGDARTNLRYLYNYIGVRPGDPYDESAIVGLGSRLRELPFVQQRQQPYVLFGAERTKLYLFLDHRRASAVSGILGVQPDAITGDVVITGDLDLKLRNALRRGEAINLNWRRLADRTQDLRLGFTYPYVFNTPFGTDLNLSIFRRDTTFLEVNARAALEYLLPLGDKLSVFVNSRTSDRLGGLSAPTPGLADVDLLSYGFAVLRERLDYRLNPRRGHALKAEASAGNKRSVTGIPGEGGITEVRTVQYELAGQGALHLPLGGRSTIRFAGQGGWMVNDRLFTNELYRIGGLKTMRGADEASIFCSAYAIGTVEYRFLFEQNSNFLLFVDQGWWENAAGDAYVKDSPLGFGLGANFETKAGIFSLTYALGRQFSNPIELRSGKVHFGFLSLF